MDYCFTFKKKVKKNGSYCTNYLSGGPNLAPPPQISSMSQYKTLKIDFFFCHFHNSISPV